MTNSIKIFPDSAALAQAAAELWRALADEAMTQYGRFLVALSGGSTPLALFRLLSQPPYAASLPWAQTHVFWGDERLTPPEDAGSNYGQAYQALLRHVPIPPGQVHRAKGEYDPETAVSDYAAQLGQLAGAGAAWPRFDLVLLGMGGDGHTASLFPGPIPPAERQKPVMAVTAVYENRPAQRITLTPLVINDARHILFLVTGASKAQALTAVLHGPRDLQQWPAQRIQPAAGALTWFVDRAAAPS